MIWNPLTRAVCADSGNCSWIRGSNNLFYGSGAAPRNTNIVNSVNANPQYTGLSQWDFHLQANSPARNKGVDTGLQTDRDGVAQGGGEGHDIGAFHFAHEASP